MLELQCDNPKCKYSATLMDQLLYWECSQHKQGDGTDAFAPILKLFCTFYLIYVSGAVDFSFERDFIFG
jgi:hypothetical protein